jgi:hypothetical protein
MVVTANADHLVRDAVGRRQTASRIAGFIRTQPGLGDLAGRLAGVTD